MKKFYLFLFALFVFCVLALSASNAPVEALGRLFIAEPALVHQPSYAGMRFYVYRPHNLPPGWYATFDGYPVFRNRDGVWVYGTFAGPNLIPTHFVVGSIVPSMAGLIPYAQPLQISSFTTLPRVPQMVTQPWPIIVGDPPTHSTYKPDWLFNSRFMALGSWRETVDRIGILHRVNTPVAWRGDFPRVIYAWNGNIWFQMMAREGDRPVDVLRDNMHTLTRQVRQNNFTWFQVDMPILAQQAGQWGFYWMGEVMAR